MARAKLFTPDNRLIVARVGALAPEDIQAVGSALRETMPLAMER